ncbi:MAG: ExeM/NucH family extracellular endonuclease [Burkholderiaceae bacterium]|nr:ExeM/NucH family extracellular endonuclease [Burkholderiaceae bacterium]
MKLKPLVSLLAAAFAAPAALASANGLVISQVYGGGGNNGATYRNDFIEVFNAGAAPVSVSGWSVQYASSSGTTWQVTTLPDVLLQPGKYLLVQQAAGAGGTTDLPTADKIGTIAMSGTQGKVALVSSTTALSGNNPVGGSVVDLVGFGGANGFETAPTAALSNSTAAIRSAGGCTDTDVNSADFAIAAPTPRNSSAPANVCGGVIVDAPIVPECPDGSAAAGKPGLVTVTAKDADSIVTGATKVGTWPTGFSLDEVTPAAADGGSATAKISVAGDVAIGSYTMDLLWSNNEAQNATCSIKVAVSGATPIYTIQGSGSQSPLKDQTVSTGGVVTKLMGNGFYLQDSDGDGDPATSDGIFVFTSTAPTVTVGQKISLSAKVAEFNTGASTQSAANPVTQLTTVSGLSVQSSGHAITPTEVDLTQLGADGLEPYEGMLVKLTGPLMVQQNFFLGRYGQLTVSGGERLMSPTNLLRPGVDAQALLTQNLRRTVILDDGSSAQNVNPTPYIGADNTVRAGDTTDTIVGVVDYGLATSSNAGATMYRIQPVATPVFARSNPRTAAPASPGGNVRVAGANVLNYFTTFTNGQNVLGQSGQGCTLGASTSASNCRGASNLAEYVRQRDKIVANLRALNADVIGLMEVQNNGNAATQTLVEALNTAIGGTVYAAAPLPAVTGTDAIRVALIYKPATLGLISGSTLSDPHPVNNRPTFAQGFVAPNGERFAVVVNHLKSKGSCPGAGDPDADQGDLQGCFNATRVEQAQQLRNFVGQVQAAAGTPDVILLGDFNALAQEDPIHTLTQDGFVIDQLGRFNPNAYSYVFDGMAGRLDHALATPSITPKIVGANNWHINADEPTIIDYNQEFKQPACPTCGPDYYTATAYRSSDHDPVILGLNLVKAVKGSVGRDTIVGTTGDDVIEGGFGADTLTGNGGRDQFVYSSVLDGGDTISDFKPGVDLLVLTKLLQSLGIVSAEPWAQGYVSCTPSALGALIGIDPDGSAGPQKSRALVMMKGQSCANINASSFKF